MFRSLASRCNNDACRQLVRGYKRKIPIRMFGPGMFFREPWPRGGPAGWVEKEMTDMFRGAGRMMQRCAEGPFWRHSYGPFTRGWYCDDASDEMKVDYGDDSFKVTLDVSEFSPEELSMKIVDSTITITGSHEEKPDEHGTVSREFKRLVSVPEDVDLDTITCSVSPEGIMKILGKVKQPEGKERTINIEREPKKSE